MNDVVGAVVRAPWSWAETLLTVAAVVALRNVPALAYVARALSELVLPPMGLWQEPPPRVTIRYRDVSPDGRRGDWIRYAARRGRAWPLLVPMAQLSWQLDYLGQEILEDVARGEVAAWRREVAELTLASTHPRAHGASRREVEIHGKVAGRSVTHRMTLDLPDEA